MLIAANRANREFHAPWVTPPVDETGFAAWLADCALPNREVRLARLAETGALVGVVSLTEIVHRALCSAYLGFYGLRDMAGQGLMTEAVGSLVRLAFDAFGLHRVEANVQPGNAPSLALLARLGFRREGFSPRYLFIAGAWRDHARFALLADEAPGEGGSPPDRETPG